MLSDDPGDTAKQIRLTILRFHSQCQYFQKLLTRMGLVATWLAGCGLSHAVPNFTAAGIVTPAALAELDLAHYEALGVSSAEDRRKLFYLVQRIKLAVEKERKENANKATTPASLEEQVDALVQATTSSTSSPAMASKENESPREQTKLVSPSSSGTGENPPYKSGIPSPKTSPKRNSPPSKLTPPKALSNRRVTSAGETTTAPPKEPSSQLTKKDSASEEGDIDGSSTWEDGEEDECADDEASIAVNKTGPATRRSKRIAEKGNGSTGIAKRSVSPKKKTLTKPKFGTSGLKTPQTKTRAGSSLPRSATRSTRSQLQNPSKSMRTGKQLSTIPADKIAPMSPLTTVPPPQLGAQKTTANKSGISSRTAKSKLRGSNSGSASENSDSESSRSRRSRRTTMAGHLNRSNGSMSDSDSSVNRRRRKSMGRVPAPKTRTSLTKGRVSNIGGTTKKSTIKPTTSTAGKKGPKKTIYGNGAVDTSFKTQIEALRQEVSLDYELFCEDAFHEDDEEEDDLIRVIVRKRPFSQVKPSDIDVIHPLEYGYYGKMLVYQPNTRVDLTKEINTVPFAFDGVFGEQYNNSQIYDKSVKNLIPVVLDGQHSTVFAFGCTGSGKTHTMMGSNFTGKKVVEEENMGLYYMAALDLFQYLEDFDEYSHLTVGVSLFEIYGGKLYDLLNDRRAVKCLEDHKGKVQFPGLSEHRIEGPADLIEYIELGAQSRSTGTTSRNADSSRSHAVLQMHLRKTVGRKQNVEHGRLTFIDLAGSERGADTANYSRATRLEGAEINTSLLALKEVIRARARGGSMTHVPFRGSKLTQVLKESFVGDNNRCLMIACIAPDFDSCEQTLNTLRYADRVKERNPDSGALPSGGGIKRKGRRRTNARTRSTASISSIVSTSDQSMLSSDKRSKRVDTTSEESDTKSSLKESGPENTITSTTNLPFEFNPTTSVNRTLSATVSEEDDAEADAMLAAVLSEDCSVLASDGEVEPSQMNDLVSELVATHESFLSAVLGMVQDEINLVLKMSIEPTGLDVTGPQLESMLQNQSSLISDLRECFQTYESIQATELGEQLQTHRSVLTSILNVVKEEEQLASELDPESSESDQIVELIEALQQNKLSQISELQACFSTSSEKSSKSTPSAPQTVESTESGVDSSMLLQESFIADAGEDNLSDFEDLRF